MVMSAFCFPSAPFGIFKFPVLFQGLGGMVVMVVHLNLPVQNTEDYHLYRLKKGFFWPFKVCQLPKVSGSLRLPPPVKPDCCDMTKQFVEQTNLFFFCIEII